MEPIATPPALQNHSIPIPPASQNAEIAPPASQNAECSIVPRVLKHSLLRNIFHFAAPFIISHSVPTWANYILIGSNAAIITLLYQSHCASSPYAQCSDHFIPTYNTLKNRSIFISTNIGNIVDFAVNAPKMLQTNLSIATLASSIASLVGNCIFR